MNNENTPLPTTDDRPAAERVAEANAYREDKRMGRDLIDSPIVSLAKGEEIGRVHDVIFNPAQGRLVGMTIKVKGGLFRHGKTLLLRTESVHAIGEDAVTVQDESVLEEIDQDVADFTKEIGDTVIGKRLMTADGDFLGTIDDVLVDRQSRRIAACKVSGGLWNDLMRGQTDVPIENIMSIGPDVVVVPAAVRSQIEAVTGGLIGAAQVAGEKIVEAKDVVVEKTGQAAETVGEKIEEARTAAAEKIEAKETEYAVGKVAGSNVLADDGTVIVREGETIDASHVAQAQATGKMHALAAAAGKAHAAELYDEAKQKTAAGIETVKEKTAAGLESVREGADKAQDAFKDKQGELLLGKTAGRDVVAPDGSVVVRAGATVGETEVAHARTMGLLGDMTAAVGVQALSNAKDAAKERVDDAKESLAQRADAAKRDAIETRDTLTQPALTQPALSPAPENNLTVIQTDRVVIQPRAHDDEFPAERTDLPAASAERGPRLL